METPKKKDGVLMGIREGARRCRYCVRERRRLEEKIAVDSFTTILDLREDFEKQYGAVWSEKPAEYLVWLKDNDG